MALVLVPRELRTWLGLKSPEDDAYDDLVRSIEEFNKSVPARTV
jgi:hypothetical protein